MKKSIVFATSNQQKVNEVLLILGSDFPYEIIPQKLELPELQADIEEICVKKCLEASRLVGGRVLVEDSSLCYNALNGLPGPYIKWFEEKVGADGLFKMLDGFDDKRAEAVCTVGYCAFCTGDEVQLFQGRVPGRIVEPTGSKEFGWDCVFLPDGYELTYGQMSRKEKNKISHRYLAFTKFRNYILNNNV